MSFNLWDEPVVEHIQRRRKTPLADDSDAESPPRPTKRSRQTLFLPGSDDESDIEVATRRASQKDIDLDAIFDGIDDVDDDSLALKPLKVVNADDLERQMEAQYRKAHPALTPHQILSSSSPARDTGGGTKNDDKNPDEKKPRRRPLLLNEGLLLGEKGFPELIKNFKDFKVKGKGHELSDLNRLLGVYQFWTHGLYPKTQFRDTVTRIEKICHSKRMQVALSVWKDEAKGLPTQPEDSEDEDMEPRSGSNASTPREFSEPARSDLRSSSTSPLSRPPSSASEYDDIFDDDLEALLQQESTFTTSGALSTSLSVSKTTTTKHPTTDDDAFWAAMDDLEDEAPNILPPPPKSIPMDEDQEMWDIVDEANKSATNQQADSAPRPSPPPPLPPQGYADPADWDDMYV